MERSQAVFFLEKKNNNVASKNKKKKRGVFGFGPRVTPWSLAIEHCGSHIAEYPPGAGNI